MATTIDELTITYEENGVQTVKELAKEVLTRGAWSTIIYKYQSWNNKDQAYGGDLYSIRRYQKRNGEYQLRSKFNISGKDQAKQIIDILSKWIEE